MPDECAVHRHKSDNHMEGRLTHDDWLTKLAFLAARSHPLFETCRLKCADGYVRDHVNDQ